MCGYRDGDEGDSAVTLRSCPCGDVTCAMPLCSDCREWHASSGDRCRDCDIEYGLKSMECSSCKRMRYRQDSPAPLANFGAYLWGAPCKCAPCPLTIPVVQK